MVTSLEEVKLFLKVDSSEEDSLITGIIKSAEETCENILRFPLTDFLVVPDIVKQTILYITSNIYEKREDVDIKEVISVAKILLLSFRKEKW